VDLVRSGLDVELDIKAFGYPPHHARLLLLVERLQLLEDGFCRRQIRLRRHPFHYLYC